MDASVTTGILLRDVAHVREVHEAISAWIDIQEQIEQFDAITNAGTTEHPIDVAVSLGEEAFGVALTRAEVRTILVERRSVAEKLLENKGVRVGRMEGVR